MRNRVGYIDFDLMQIKSVLNKINFTGANQLC
jgi:hypothetical protein